MRRMIKPGKALRAVFFIFLILLISSCRTTQLQFSKNSQTSASYTIEKIDLTSADLQIMTNGPDFKLVSPRAFARQSRAEIVINTLPFKKDGKPVGILIDDGKVYSPAVKKYAALAFYKEESGFRAEIFDSQEEIDLSEGKLPYIAVGGFWTILRDGKKNDFIDHKDYRIAVGLCDSGKTLLIMCAKKMSYGDCAEIFQELDVEIAMQFDGGHSAQMVVNGEKAIKAPFRRKVPVVLGFRAKP
ncbi:putative periplasmic protein (DUF2233) [Treponema sp. JC4]|uniref:phosphodiester glycosidase family protein n=1 Tax=Treponema sp. JC4 TaxID=1124982 RepID=UPI00025B0D6F|nr:phosphodiester glycosidase family protein [Treponema sp. JC4]EID85965.1 putative periplasmic protein (DUF2233) [Treponema sp. JC4]